MLTLKTRDLDQGTRVSLQHQSAAEVAELDQKIDAEIAARQKREQEERNKPKPKVVVTLPNGSQEVSASEREIEFQLASGKAKATVDALVKQLRSDGWQADPVVGDDSAGQISLKKGEGELSVLYVDPGLIPAEVTITASGVNLERSPDNKK
jgi:hypothetical protein